MRALTYHGAQDVRVDTVPDPAIQDQDDIILRVTATAICGSDLHLYHGKIPQTEPGDIFGHEFMGVVEETGRGVTNLQVGDRVVIPFVIACGSCFFCQLEQFAACETTNTGRGAILNKKSIPPGAALFGYSHLYGGVPGGQADFVRVPKANVGPFKVPTALPDDKVLFLSDILPTAWQAVTNAQVGQGSTVAIYGAGPVGLLSAACARMLGAQTIFMVDDNDYRLAFAREAYGVVPINFEQDDDPADSIIRLTPGMRGVDAVIDAVGFEAKGSTTETLLTTLKIEGSSGKALRQSIAAVRRGGVVSVPGVYAGFIHAFMFGDAFDKGLTFKMGQTHVQKFLPELLEHIEAGRLEPELIVTHRLALEEAAMGYRMFDQKQDDCRKVILVPGAAAGTLGPDHAVGGPAMIDPATGMRPGERYSVESLERVHQFPGFFLDGRYYLGPELLTAVGWLEGQRFIYDALDATGEPVFPGRAAGDIKDLTLTLVDGTRLALTPIDAWAAGEALPRQPGGRPKRHDKPGVLAVAAMLLLGGCCLAALHRARR